MPEVQTRNADGQLCYFACVEDALDHACEDVTVWKYSYRDEGGKPHRFVRQFGALWFDQPINIDQVMVLTQ